MASGNGGLSWADQWGSRDEEPEKKQQQGKGKKMQEMKDKAKLVTSAGAEKAKVAATVGAEKAKIGALKVKAGTLTGFKWIKEHVTKKNGTK